jgi:arylsulfatase A-like enzyme
VFAELDWNLRRILDVLDELGIYDDILIACTSDHDDACGSHGLRAKLPCVCEEVIGVPLIMRVPGMTQAGAETNALATHVDLATTLCALGGVDIDDSPTLWGVDLFPALADPAATPRNYVFFSQDAAQSDLVANTRHAVRGFFDGEAKYARYYGIGGGVDRAGNVDDRPKLFGDDAAFEDHDYEWYELGDKAGHQGPS